jgi:hypothetical protein
VFPIAGEEFHDVIDSLGLSHDVGRLLVLPEADEARMAP